MDHTLARKIAAVAGLLFVVSIVVSAALPGTPPMADDSVVKVANFYTDHRDKVLISNYVGGFGVVFMLVFASALRNFFRYAEGDLPGPSSLILLGGATTGVVAIVGGVFSLVLAYRLPLNAALVQSFSDANLLAFSFIGFPIAVLIAGTSAAVLRTGALPSGVAILGAVVVVLQLVGAASFAKSGTFMPGGSLGLVALLSFLIWALVVSLALFRRKSAGPAAPASSAPSA